jgi:excisionase family DNA binding protein
MPDNQARRRGERPDHDAGHARRRPGGGIAQRAAELVVDRHSSPYMNATEAARYLSCPRSRVYDLIQVRMLQPVRDGRRVLLKRSDLDAYLNGLSNSAG